MTMNDIVTTFAEHGVTTSPFDQHDTPQVTRYKLTLGPKQKVSRVFALDEEVALALGVESVRIVRERGHIVVEVPRAEREFFTWEPEHVAEEVGDPLAFPIGRGADGMEWRDLATLPHLLVAGTTGSGKSVALNIAIASLLAVDPERVQLHLVDPKRVEFADYEGFPHVASISDEADDALGVIEDLVAEMEDRYKMLREAGVKQIAELDEDEAVPYTVLIVDEFADLMMGDKARAKEIEASIVRLAQKGRAAGIHLILATQKPTVDVFTGLIKSNIPGRWVFRVNSSSDSRVALDSNGAEKLLGKGDSLFYDAQRGLTRVQTPALADGALESLRDAWEGTESGSAAPERTPEEEAALEAEFEEILAKQSEAIASALDQMVDQGVDEVHSDPEIPAAFTPDDKVGTIEVTKERLAEIEAKPDEPTQALRDVAEHMVEVTRDATNWRPSEGPTLHFEIRPQKSSLEDQLHEQVRAALAHQMTTWKALLIGASLGFLFCISWMGVASEALGA